MQNIKVKGIIINDINYSESSKILHILTEDYGTLGVISKGCRNLKSKLRSTSIKFTYGYFYISYKENSLSTLLEVDVLNEFKNIKTNLTKIGYSSYLMDFAGQVIKESNSPDIFRILEAALLKIEDGLSPDIITNIVELKYLSFLGVMPVLDRCSKCGETKNIITINSDAGGLLCENCYQNEYIVDEKTIKLFRMFSIVDINKIKEFNINERNKQEINNFLENYYLRYTGLYLKSKNFLTQINKN